MRAPPFDSVDLIAPAAALTLVGGFVVLLATHFKRCPPGKVMIISGRTAEKRGFRIIESGAALVLPFIQEHAYLELAPIRLEATVPDVVTADGTRFDADLMASVAVDVDRLETAATRLLGLSTEEIRKQADAALHAALRRVAAALSTEQATDAEVLRSALERAFGADLAELGLMPNRLSLEALRPQAPK